MSPISKVRAGGKTVDVVRFSITDESRSGATAAAGVSAVDVASG